jgi:hypothetical protein
VSLASLSRGAICSQSTGRKQRAPQASSLLYCRGYVASSRLPTGTVCLSVCLSATYVDLPPARASAAVALKDVDHYKETSLV